MAPFLFRPLHRPGHCIHVQPVMLHFADRIPCKPSRVLYRFPKPGFRSAVGHHIQPVALGTGFPSSASCRISKISSRTCSAMCRFATSSAVSVTRRNCSDRWPTNPTLQTPDPFERTVSTSIGSLNCGPVRTWPSWRRISVFKSKHPFLNYFLAFPLFSFLVALLILRPHL